MSIYELNLIDLNGVSAAELTDAEQADLGNADLRAMCEEMELYYEREDMKRHRQIADARAYRRMMR